MAKGTGSAAGQCGRCHGAHGGRYAGARWIGVAGPAVVGDVGPIVLTIPPRVLEIRRAGATGNGFYEKVKGGYIPFVVIINFPPIKKGRDAEFREWFAWSNKEFARHRGFIGRRLLEPTEGGDYAAIVEHESRETFMDMHNSPGHDEAARRVGPLFDGNPTPRFYEVIVG